MPLLSLAEIGDYKKAKSLTVAFVNLLVDSEYALKIKVDCLVQLYNSVHTNSGIKSFSFEKLIELCLVENCFDNVVECVRKIVVESAKWNLTKDERRSLYKTSARALDQTGDSSCAFKVMHAYLKLY
jgi:hypothetical protein